jgi:FKBP-type peptidyl-prolyl cis-trans isomerase SlyD
MAVKKSDPIENGLVAGIYYTLTVDDGEVIDTNRGRGGGPLAVLVGCGNIVAGLEKACLGKRKGDRFAVDVPPEEGYGKHDERLLRRQPRESLPPELELAVGQRLRGRGPQGEAKYARVVALEGDEVVLDENHPLAGKTLHFDVEIVGVREATPDERAHRHAHGRGGHRH